MGLSRGKILPLMVALTATCTAQPAFARNDGTNPNRPEDNGIYWHGVGGAGIGVLSWRASRCLDIPWYFTVPGTIASALAVGLLREVAQHDWHLTKHQLAEGLAWGAGSGIGLGVGFTIEWGTGKRPCAREGPRTVQTTAPQEPFGGSPRSTFVDNQAERAARSPPADSW